MNSGTGIGFGHNIVDIIPPINIVIFVLFNRGALCFSNKRKLWHCTEKSESKHPGYNIIFENAERENNFEVEKVGRKRSVIFNHVDSNHINTNSNHSNHVNSNHADWNNDSSNVRASNQLLSWDGVFVDAASSTVSTITPLDYVQSIHTYHTPSMVHSLHF